MRGHVAGGDLEPQQLALLALDAIGDAHLGVMNQRQRDQVGLRQQEIQIPQALVPVMEIDAVHDEALIDLDEQPVRGLVDSRPVERFTSSTKSVSSEPAGL